MTEQEISAREAAKELGVHLHTVQEMCRDGKLPARRIGARGRWRIRRSAVVPPTDQKQTSPPPASEPSPSSER